MSCGLAEQTKGPLLTCGLISLREFLKVDIWIEFLTNQSSGSGFLFYSGFFINIGNIRWTRVDLDIFGNDRLVIFGWGLFSVVNRVCRFDGFFRNTWAGFCVIWFGRWVVVLQKKRKNKWKQLALAFLNASFCQISFLFQNK